MIRSIHLLCFPVVGIYCTDFLQMNVRGIGWPKVTGFAYICFPCLLQLPEPVHHLSFQPFENQLHHGWIGKDFGSFDIHGDG